MNTQLRKPISLDGVIIKIYELENIQSKSVDTLIKKRTFKFETFDGQLLFLECRNSKSSLLDNFSEMEKVTVKVIFRGSEKNDKKYNNLHAVDIISL